jgi:hypothetical protein
MSQLSRVLTRAVTGGAFLITLCMLTPGVAHASCRVTVKEPYAARIAGQRVIIAVGVRGTDCTERKLLFVRLRQHRRFWFDKTLAEVRFTVTNASLSARYYCNGGVGEKGVFTEAWLQLEEKHKSGPVKISACG